MEQENKPTPNGYKKPIEASSDLAGFVLTIGLIATVISAFTFIVVDVPGSYKTVFNPAGLISTFALFIFTLLSYAVIKRLKEIAFYSWKRLEQEGDSKKTTENAVLKELDNQNKETND